MENFEAITAEVQQYVMSINKGYNTVDKVIYFVNQMLTECAFEFCQYQDKEFEQIHNNILNNNDYKLPESLVPMFVEYFNAEYGFKFESNLPENFISFHDSVETGIANYYHSEDDDVYDGTDYLWDIDEF